MITQEDIDTHLAFQEKLKKQCELWCKFPGGIVYPQTVEDGEIFFTEDSADYSENEDHTIPIPLFLKYTTAEAVAEFRKEEERKALQIKAEKESALKEYQDYHKKKSLETLIKEFPDYAREVLETT